MGRLFIKDIEGPAYKCKYCPIEFALYHDEQILREPFYVYQPNIENLYYFPKCFNVEIGTATTTLTYTSAFDGHQINNSMFQVFCIGCGSRIGLFYEGAAHGTLKYNEGNFFIIRTEIHAPPEGSDNENPEN